ncbi:ead/Ea22-like family protein [Klebsiella pneumoniae]|uniref:ead/Ea22-like family protein n=1 Tax=Klebsiella pneumoniae TaxID=573 RepID=UPI0010915519|nr:ead/Ea22-like family protein [Klebsiella pneumoniae]EKW4520801.1 ead/Ea22-like family protein [Klebsiella pneumoniae]EKZ5522351.1 ead/Ea22-like family protein [Klebsiella pneumoniae]EKZ5527849.1 ead/Ea22-like family protein [Klebsiella pneumoniae]ELB7281946.1 ead/Ea22-like family protein [Klebsiella pneumoniae]ELN5391373.1 ead/Ea22-like family protein [Klebsiella pneumoniae]
MTTDITELAQSLKAAAEKASNGDWVKESGDGWEACCSANDQANGGFIIAHFVGPDAAENREFVQAANPANVLALVEALEYYKSREERVTSLVRDNSKSWDELYRQVEAKGKRNVELVEALESEKRICATWRKTAEANSEKLEKAQQQMTESENRVRKQNRHICELFDDNTALRQRIAGLEARTVTVKQGEVLVTVAGFTGCGKSAIAGEIEIAMKAIGLPVTWANGDSEKRMTGADWLTAIEMYKPTVRIVEVNIPRAAGIKVEAK